MRGTLFLLKKDSLEQRDVEYDTLEILRTRRFYLVSERDLLETLRIVFVDHLGRPHFLQDSHVPADVKYSQEVINQYWEIQDREASLKEK